MPPFVYLVPFVALFEATRFTGIVAAIVYAAPVVIKIVADGIRQVSADHGRGGDVGRVEHLAADHQGPAADVRSAPWRSPPTRA